MAENFENDLKEVLDLYTDILLDQKRSPEIISTYCAEVSRFFYWWAERGHMVYGSQRVSREDIKAYLNDLNQSVHPAACNRALAALRAFFAFWLNDAPENNPTRTIPKVWDDLKANSWLDAEQQHQLESAIDQQLQMPLDTVYWQVRWVRAAALARLLLHTGMHAVEARLLCLGDLHLGESLGMVHVRGKRERRLQLDGPTCAALRAWLAVRPNVDQDWLWLEMYRGKPQALSVRGVWRACWRMANLAGLDSEAVSPRILRHTCAHNLLAAGESPRLVTRLLIFDSIEITLRYQ
jgi:site-specific recombinase XerD